MNPYSGFSAWTFSPTSALEVTGTPASLSITIITAASSAIVVTRNLSRSFTSLKFLFYFELN